MPLPRFSHMRVHVCGFLEGPGASNLGILAVGVYSSSEFLEVVGVTVDLDLATVAGWQKPFSSWSLKDRCLLNGLRHLGQSTGKPSWTSLTWVVFSFSVLNLAWHWLRGQGNPVWVSWCCSKSRGLWKSRWQVGQTTAISEKSVYSLISFIYLYTLLFLGF